MPRPPADDGSRCPGQVPRPARHGHLTRPEPPLVVVLGATATGKSEVAVELARSLDGEVVSFDASCVYRGLDIGTAKPSAASRRLVPHHLVDVCDPSDGFSAARFLDLASRALRDIASRGKRPVAAGGTGLYLRTLLRGLAPSPPATAVLRARLEGREVLRPGSLHRLLRRLDPAAARVLGPRDRLRLVRALEHRILAGRPLSAEQSQWKRGDIRPSVKIGLELPRPVRERRIRERADAMLAAGLVAEVRGLLEAGVPRGARAFQALGHRDVMRHLDGEITLAQLRQALIVSTRQYAKRQDTWFRREPNVTWLRAADDAGEMPRVVASALEVIRKASASRIT